MQPKLRDQVAQWLSLQWAPQQISRALVRHYPADHSMRVSHETIYRTLFIQARGALEEGAPSRIYAPGDARRRRGRSSSARP